MRITAWLYRRFGSRAAHLLMYVVATYFFLSDAQARRASAQYLARLYETPMGRQALSVRPGHRQTFRHFVEFGRSILDRVGFWIGDRDRFELSIRGQAELSRIADDGRGAVVLGSHLGSFDAMRLLAQEDSPIPVRVLMYTRHAPRINAMLDGLGRLNGREQASVSVIPVAPAGVGHVLEARACVNRGEVVAILADRVPPNEAHRVTRVKFLGEEANLPEGPLLLAALLGCPVLWMVALRAGENRYEIHVERFADRIVLPRPRRAEALAEHCQAYADRLAFYCVRAPYQWFNFYNFWRTKD
jgi:predicted LPLAT superfamily acyltransferase